MATDIVTLATLEDILAFIGQSSDPAGTATLFARLVQIANFTDSLESLIGSASPSTGGTDTLFKFIKQVNDAVNSNGTKIGSNTDVAGTGTVFARLAQIAGYTDSVEGLIGTANPTTGDSSSLFNFLKLIYDLITAKVGSNTDPAGTSTLFAYLAQIAGYTDTLEGSLGQTTDAASSTGSAHAKLKDIKTAIGNSGDPASASGNLHQKVSQLQNSVNAIPTVTPQRPRKSYLNKFSTTSSSFVTALQVNGIGKLFYCSQHTARVQIILDGSLVYDFDSTGLSPTYFVSPAGENISSYGGYSLNVTFCFLSFKQSLQINVLANGGTAQCNFGYEIE
jgi:hypothetical protein